MLDCIRQSHHVGALMSRKAESGLTMDVLVSLCKRRGIIFPSSEIYGGLNGFYDYGPLGVELRRNVKGAWWRDMVQRRDDIVGIETSIIMHPKVWEASGHIDGFSDPMVDCRESKNRYRADQLFFSEVRVDGEVIGHVSVLEDEDADLEALATERAANLKRKLGRQGQLEPLSLRSFSDARPEEYALVPSPATGKPGSLTPPRDFNLMFQTHVGALGAAASLAYLRPETAQGIFANFKNVVNTWRVKVPFGIAQIGKSFRNEITPRNFIFRTREFEQMEMEYFIPPDEDLWPRLHRQWIDIRKRWFVDLGIPGDLLGEDQHPPEKLSHYSRATTDITFRYPFGVHELEGVAARGNYDLAQHQEHSGQSLEYFDEVRRERYLPHVIEPALGVDRAVLAILTAAYAEDEIDGEERVVLRFHPRIAPVKAAVFPLLRNKPALVERAGSLYHRLQRRWNVFYDASGAIGRRYRRQDEIGTPFGITIDFQTLEGDGTVTLRDRDTTEQVRLSEDDVVAFLEEKLE